MLIGIVGFPNTGKSTFFSAASLVDVPIANRPFTTIKPNRAVSWVKTKCIHDEKGVKCQPVNSKCMDGWRLVPIELIDVAGLVRGAHEGRGLGNQFLSDLMQAKALIHVLDASGSVDLEGNVVERGSADPCDYVEFLENEIAWWIKGILEKNWRSLSKKAGLDARGPAAALAEQLSGLGITEAEAKHVLKEGEFSERPDMWGEEEILEFSKAVRAKSKPIVIVANKIDVPGAKENYEKLKQKFPDRIIVPTCSEAELALRKAERGGAIKYVPGEGKFEVANEGTLGEKQKNALGFIQKKVLDAYGSTGVQEAINRTAFELLNLIVVYPVQDANKWCSAKGNVLPDAYLLPKGSNAYDLAVAVHTDFGPRFIAAVDCRSGKKLGKEHELQNNDVVKIQLKN
ncbi:MAG: redox-regulated ATPase YchF [Candidatus Diapherotrites archaeon]